MNVLRVRSILYFIALGLGAIMLLACGGSGTFSPTATGTSTTPTTIAVSISPSPATTYPGGQIQFTAKVTGTNNTAVNWSVITDGGGTITSTGLYQAPAEVEELRAKPASISKVAKPFDGGQSNQYTVQAVSQADPTKSATVVITVSDLSITVTPSNPTVIEGQTVTFSALVAGVPSAPQGVNWYGDDGGGTINKQTGVFTAGFTPGTYQIYAQSTAETGIQGYMDLTVVPPTGLTVTVTPATASTSWVEGQPVQLTAKVTGSTDQSVTWSIVPAANGTVFGTITSSGLYAASPPNEEDYVPTVTVKATSVADPTKSGTATITIVNNS